LEPPAIQEKIKKKVALFILFIQFFFSCLDGMFV
jgi:hypothetical protein